MLRWSTSTALALILTAFVVAESRADVLVAGADATAPINGPNRLDIMAGRIANGATLGGYNFGNIVTFDSKSSTASLATLEQYSTVVVWSNFGFADATTFGNNLADYVDHGGNVIVMSVGSAIPPGGRWATGGYDPLQSPGYAGDVASSLGTYVHSSPLFAGVTSIQGEYIQSGSVRPGATLLGSWVYSFDSVNPAPLAIVSNGFSGKVVNLNFYGAYPYPNTSGDIDRLIANAINYVTPTAVPEPATFIIGLCSLALCAVSSRFRRAE
ncbi:MAG: hypothetical protein JSS02_27155 [Planctomycetes bacterium]|nr:hypothetical protein [Planctomycetota bacterium]